MKCLSALSAVLILTWLGQGEAICGYKACNPTKANKVNIHLVPHSHDDVGWLKTVDQYYYGARNDIQRAGVQYILDSVTVELMKDKSRRFIQVETEFFYTWFNEQSEEMKKNVKALVSQGRLEFVGGGWSMHDEAATNYQSIIDQFTLAFKFLNHHFGTCGLPTVAWQIDPFGHSSETASLFAQFGYDGQFFARLDWLERAQRFKNLTAEMIWQASDNLGEVSEIFTGVLYNHYSAPKGFCFDTLCTDKPIIDGKTPENNVDEKVNAFISYITNLSKKYRAPHLMVPMGDDFTFGNANINYKNIDKLIKYINELQILGSKFHLLYSTPSCYLNALHKSLRLTWPVKKGGDFFPYSTDSATYWTGYYTSRPNQKKFERDGNNYLQITKQLVTLANLTSAKVNANLDQLRQAMGIMQHHDAITGTEKQHVANDYNRLLSDSLTAAEENNRLALQSLTNLTSSEFFNCRNLNISLCEFTEKLGDNLMVTVYNPLNWANHQLIKIPVANKSYVVTDGTGKVIKHQIVPVPSEVLALRNSSTTMELVFAPKVNKLDHFYINSKAQPNYDALTHDVTPKSGKDFILENSRVKLKFNSRGMLSNIQMNDVSEKIVQEFHYYRAAKGNNTQAKYRSSGAYIFRNNGSEMLIGAPRRFKVLSGPLVKEVHQYYNDYISQVIRLSENRSAVDFEWMVGPIPIEDNIGKEIITRFTSEINSKGVYYTDSNGREMLKRVRNMRDGFKPNLNETVSSNYYPVNSRISVMDKRLKMTLITDRSQGGSSLKDGALELMLHRRLLHDDAFGVGEALNETINDKGIVARGIVQLILSPVGNKSITPERYAALELHLPYWKFFSNASRLVNKTIQKLPAFSSLPKEIHVLTLEPYSHNERILRLENILEKTETSTVTFNIRFLFDALGGQEIYETTLGANKKLSEMKRFKFHRDGTKPKNVEYYTSKHTPLVAKKSDVLNKFTLSMGPLQIRTFKIKWK